MWGKTRTVALIYRTEEALVRAVRERNVRPLNVKGERENSPVCASCIDSKLLHFLCAPSLLRSLYDTQSLCLLLLLGAVRAQTLPALFSLLGVEPCTCCTSTIFFDNLTVYILMGRQRQDVSLLTTVIQFASQHQIVVIGFG